MDYDRGDSGRVAGSSGSGTYIPGGKSPSDGSKLGEYYTELGVYNEGTTYKMVAGIARPQTADVLAAFKNLQTKINDVLWLHGRGTERISVDGAIGSGTRLAAMNAARYVGGSGYLDMFVQAPSETMLARYAVEIASDFASATHGATAPIGGGATVKPPVGVPGVPAGPTPPAPAPATGISALIQSSGAKVAGMIGIGYLLMSDKKKKRTYKRKRKPAKRRSRRRSRR